MSANDASPMKSGRGSADQGFSLLEMVVAMGIFSILIIVVIAAIVGFAGSIKSAKTTIEGAGTNTTIMETMDIQARYADAINRPGPGGSGARYIEFEVPKSSTTTGDPGCYQWRYDPSTGVVSQRSWGVSSTNTAVNVSGWASKGEHIVDQGGNAYPFAMLPANDAVGILRQRIQVTLITGVNGGRTTQSVVAFAARNSTSVSVTNGDANGDGQSDTTVCMQAGGRP